MASHRGRTRPSYVPRFHALEDRLALSPCSVNGSSLTITTGNGTNTVAIVDNGTGGYGNLQNTLVNGSFCVNNKGKNLLANAAIVEVTVKASKGNDAVTYTLTGTQSGTMDVDVKLGGGADTFNTNITQVINGTLTIDANAGGGSDSITVGFTGYIVGKLTIEANGKGSAPINFNVNLIDPNDNPFGQFIGTINGNNSSKATLNFQLNSQVTSQYYEAVIQSQNKNNTCIFNSGVTLEGVCTSNPAA